MRFAKSFAALTALIATSAQAQSTPSLPIASGQQLTLTLGSGTDDVTITSIGLAVMTPLDAAQATRLMALPIPDGPVTEGTQVISPVPASPMAPDQITLRMYTVEARATMLVIENGYDRGLVYHARMTVNGKSQPTDVCIVRGHLRGYEYWPFRIDRLDLSNFTLVPWKEGDPVSCA